MKLPYSSFIARVIPWALPPMLAGFALASDPASSGEPAAAQLVRDSFDYYRGEASVAIVEMRIHRPDWERTQVLKVWTLGEDKSLFTILEPSKDRGNGSLKRGSDMWMYNPRIKRVIKLPPSMMSQSWMGSDFSNNDLAKSDSLIEHYEHRIVSTEKDGEHTVYVIESTPVPGAPVVWGKEVLRIRQDLIFLEEAFYDEDGELVKTLRFSDLRMFGDKLYPARMKMSPADKPGQYTEVVYRELAFRDTLPERYFTQQSLRNPPR